MRKRRLMSTISTLQAWIVSTGAPNGSHELRQYIIKETGLPISIGLSVNKTVSKIATGRG